MKIKLGELCKIQAGGTPSRSNPEYWKNGNIPWVKISDINSKYLDVTTEFITEEGLRNSSTKLIRKGSLLYTIFATLGEVCITNIDVTTNQAIAGISLTNDIVDVDYLYYYLKSLKQYVNSIGRGVAQNNINLTLLRNFEIPIIDKKSQVLIADSLTKIEKIIDIKKNQLLEYDQLIKSRFVEMFGDIQNNSKQYRTQFLKDICSIKTGGTPSRNHPEYFEGTIPWITTVALGKLEIDKLDAIELITEDAVNNSSTKIIPAGSILFGTRVGVGKTSINKVDLCTNQDIAAITEISKDYNLIFLKKVLDSYSEYFNNQKRGATIQGITTDTLKNIHIPIIDLEVQKEFAAFFEQVDKLKFAVQKSLDETQTLFDSLMQKYFG